MSNAKNFIAGGAALLVLAAIVSPASAIEFYNAAQVRADELGGKPFVSSERYETVSKFGTADVVREDVARIGGKVEVLSSHSGAASGQPANGQEQALISRLGG